MPTCRIRHADPTSARPRHPRLPSAALLAAPALALLLALTAAPCAAQNPDTKQNEPTVNEVVYVDANAAEAAQLVMQTFLVNARAMGDSTVVLIGAPDGVRNAAKFLAELTAQMRSITHKRQAESEDRMRAEMERERQLMRERRLHEPATSRVFDVTLGQTLGESLAAVSKATTGEGGGGINVVFTDPADAKLHVRTIELRRVTVASVVHTLQSLLRLPNGEDPVRIEVKPPSQLGEMPVVTVSPSPSSARAAAGPEYQVAVFRIDSIEGSSGDPEDIARVEKGQQATLEAISTGLEVTGSSPEFGIKLHPGTGMMFVRGTPEEIRMVGAVLNQPLQVVGAIPAVAAAPAAPAASSNSRTAPDAPASTAGAAGSASPRSPSPPAPPRP